jgi:hypothetical protein
MAPVQQCRSATALKKGIANAFTAGMEDLRNVVREPNVVELKPWKSIHNTIKEPMVSGIERKEVGLSCRWNADAFFYGNTLLHRYIR